MKKIFLFAYLLISCCQFTFSQTVNSLDLKNGFRQFKFGTSPQQIKNIIKDDKLDNHYGNPNIKHYIYIENDIEKLAFVKIEAINLKFYKNKLVHIGVDFGNLDNEFRYDEYEKILDVLETAYGTNWTQGKDRNDQVLNAAIWEGKNVILELIRIDFTKHTLKDKYNSIKGYLHVYDKKLDAEMYKSQL
ncbi:hypothetical protein [Flavobacterium sp. IMCC34518]|uniref:hypothetical protein n=1 Tax=Flavobacterium sp. IMCC34518 TaxID=3003623 RepID=UPI0022AC5F80|nr:hypothetical protein [Flavobacterium sp. IMCC34518]